jgi:dihydrofolate reductase
VLRGDVVDEVSTLKEQVDGDILVYASYRLGQTLLEHDLVDEVRLVLFPVVLGGGNRLFGATGTPKALRLIENRTLGDGLAFLIYQPVRGA